MDDYNAARNYMLQMADEISRLRAENEKLREECRCIKDMLKYKWSWSSSNKCEKAIRILEKILGDTE